MSITKKYYVFYLLFFFFIGLSTAGFAQKKIQKGTASWYGSKYHGRKTSSGERYNKNHMTAAHNTLPFGTKVKVTNLKNNKSVIVKINDRGPFKRGRIIDVSEAAARKIGMVNSGVATVKVEVLSDEKSEDIAYNRQAGKGNYYTIQAGAFSSADNAKQQSKKIKAVDRNIPVTLKQERVNGRTIHRVITGRFDSRNEADKIRKKLERKGIDGIVKEVA